MFKVGDIVKVKPDLAKFYLGGLVSDAKEIPWIVERAIKTGGVVESVEIKALESYGFIHSGTEYLMYTEALGLYVPFNEDDIWE